MGRHGKVDCSGIIVKFEVYTAAGCTLGCLMLKGAGGKDFNVGWTSIAYCSPTAYSTSPPSVSQEVTEPLSTAGRRLVVGFATSALSAADTAATATSRPPQVAAITRRRIQRQPRVTRSTRRQASPPGPGAQRQDAEDADQRRSWH